MSMAYSRGMSQENATNKQPLIRFINRQQMSWRAVDVEHLISERTIVRGRFGRWWVEWI